MNSKDKLAYDRGKRLFWYELLGCIGNLCLAVVFLATFFGIAYVILKLAAK